MSCPTACGARRHGRDGRPHRPRVGKPAPASASRGRAFYASVYPSVSARRLPLSAPRRRTAQDDFCRTGEETAFGFSLRACIPHKNFISVSSVRRARALLSRAAVTSLRRFALSLRRRTAPRTGLRPRAGWLRLRAGCAHAPRGLKARTPHGRRGSHAAIPSAEMRRFLPVLCFQGFWSRLLFRLWVLAQRCSAGLETHRRTASDA